VRKREMSMKIEVPALEEEEVLALEVLDLEGGELQGNYCQEEKIQKRGQHKTNQILKIGMRLDKSQQITIQNRRERISETVLGK